MLEESIQELESRTLSRIASAATAEELEAVRVDALGRKSGLTQFSKDMGKLPPEERKRLGIPDGLIRISIGVEHPDDLVSDLQQALG